MSLIIFLVVGLLAGWIASAVMGEGGFGLFGDIIIGVIGAFIGGYVFKLLGISLPGGFIGDVIVAAIGAIILLFLVGLIRR
jgi:uncharacterized membrane protein YeaQ/YmgE (transglycosylase-associated protein family)